MNGNSSMLMIFLHLSDYSTNFNKTFIKYSIYRKAMKELNEANINTLQLLLTHLRIVAENSHENKMSAENLVSAFDSDYTRLIGP